MATLTLASRRAAPPATLAAPAQPDTIPTAHLQSVLAAFNACNLASSYLERGNIAAARRKIVQALASVNQVQTCATQGGTA